MDPTTQPTYGDNPLTAHTPPSSKAASIKYSCLDREEIPSSQTCDRKSFSNPARVSQEQIPHDQDDQRCGYKIQLSPTPESVRTSLLARGPQSTVSSTQDEPKAISNDRVRVTVPEDETADGQTRLKGIRVLQEASDKLTEMKAEMQETVFEYFNRKVLVNLSKLKAFAPLCKSIERLVATLDRLIKSIDDREHFADFKDANYLMHQLKPSLLFTLARGEQILAVKNGKDSGQPAAESWTESVRKLRRTLTDDANHQLENWARTLYFLEIDIIEKHSYREPSVRQRLKLEKGSMWLKYTVLKGKILGAAEKVPLPLSGHPSPSMYLHD